MTTITQVSFSNDALSIFVDNLKREYDLYEEMIALCEKEKNYIINGDMVKLRESLLRKHDILEEIVSIEKEKAEQQNIWEDIKEEISVDEKNIVLNFIEEFKVLIDKVVLLQKDNQELMSVDTQEKITAFKKIKTGINMNRAYSSYGANVPDTRYMNKVR